MRISPGPGSPSSRSAQTMASGPPALWTKNAPLIAPSLFLGARCRFRPCLGARDIGRAWLRLGLGGFRRGNRLCRDVAAGRHLGGFEAIRIGAPEPVLAVLGEDVDRLDQHRESHGRVDVALLDVEM